MVSKAHLTSYSRMTGSRWAITQLWLSGSWRSFCTVILCILTIFGVLQRLRPSLFFWEAETPLIKMLVLSRLRWEFQLGQLWNTHNEGHMPQAEAQPHSLPWGILCITETLWACFLVGTMKQRASGSRGLPRSGWDTPHQHLHSAQHSEHRLQRCWSEDAGLGWMREMASWQARHLQGNVSYERMRVCILGVKFPCRNSQLIF